MILKTLLNTEEYMNTDYFVMIATSPWAGPTVEVIDAPRVRTTKGKLIGKTDVPFTVELVTDTRVLPTDNFPPRDIHESPKFKLFSRKFIDALNSLGVDNIEYLPVDVTDKKTNQKMDYCVVNVLGRINALDVGESEFILSSAGGIMDVKKMVFDNDKIQGHKIFMLGEIPMLIIVHKCIKDIVESQGLTGFRFISQDEYQPGDI